MPKFFYNAKSMAGESKTGVLDAKNEYDLARLLKSEGFLLVNARDSAERKKGIPFPSIFDRVGFQEKMIFVRNLAVMVSAGVSLPRALGTLALQSKSKKFKKTLEQISEDIIRGDSFSKCLSKHPRIFSEVFQNMASIGEESGTLDNSLKILASQMERENEMRSKVKGALIYPAVVISAMIIIGILMMAIVVPKLSATFAELSVELPFTTKVIIFIGNFLGEFWYLIPFVCVVLFLIFSFLLKSRSGKKWTSRILLKIPVVSGAVKKVNSAHTSRTLGSLIGSGISLSRSLEVTARSSGNVCYQIALRDCLERVKKGSKLSESLKDHEKIYSPLVVQMVEVGEETGQTSEILLKLAEFYEGEVSNLSRNLSSIIEPALMVVVGAAVGFFAISMLQPMYSMLSAF